MYLPLLSLIITVLHLSPIAAESAQPLDGQDYPIFTPVKFGEKIGCDDIHPSTNPYFCLEAVKKFQPMEYYHNRTRYRNTALTAPPVPHDPSYKADVCLADFICPPTSQAYSNGTPGLILLTMFAQLNGLIRASDTNTLCGTLTMANQCNVSQTICQEYGAEYHLCKEIPTTLKAGHLKPTTATTAAAKGGPTG